MAYRIAGTAEDKAAYFVRRHGGTSAGVIDPTTADLPSYCRGLDVAALAIGDAVILFRDSDEIETAPIFGDAASLLAHLDKRDHAGRLIDPRPVFVVAVPRNVAEPLHGDKLA